ncbi:hypothetical protein A2276_04475 [candidate division WOR-1 bacterium RIFOXYA12_FULL_43_27]|uniref:Uncharacterized protein n=1 Tax=candidate division WOR-1 bacterium RIFOXYC2_FULL_46_14 TaxID=1802587 RepID=A0A1F4U4C5_UNCSA|nr:MAG: hypothetical protein A2276_04475 [candidate division WOR-1 bacterium RIFOXYA12_FULL_43_27]OGC18919.1 MAG: hypothetical protein A2292_08360 [candidate division WOR-1 bacterium RIFOXYB2_FULL_46_45]OGC29060.1 MAG: hypothetical protein A2232_03425 [candidate division WOR-1 bacterium RIFOXYA2_FULL_46_56]OGC39680.1 MAG: hypothetical protein A2438_06815 [candidate division WOR-1 bacterium RIFOXYC2_FULL_46_14]
MGVLAAASVRYRMLISRKDFFLPKNTNGKTRHIIRTSDDRMSEDSPFLNGIAWKVIHSAARKVKFGEFSRSGFLLRGGAEEVARLMTICVNSLPPDSIITIDSNHKIESGLLGVAGEQQKTRLYNFLLGKPVEAVVDEMYSLLFSGVLYKNGWMARATKPWSGFSRPWSVEIILNDKYVEFAK